MPTRTPISKFTPEQLETFDEHAKQVAREATVHQRNRSLAGFLILLAGLILAFITGHNDNQDSRDAIVTSGRVVSVVGCNRDFDTISATRGVLLSAQNIEDKAYKNGETTLAQHQRAVGFYGSQLKRLALPDCRLAEEAVTQDPDAAGDQQVPVAKYPGMRQNGG